MEIEARSAVGRAPPAARLRVAAAGDVHCSESSCATVAESLAAVEADVDLILLAGDLTTHGRPEQARLLADACAELSVPVLAVLGNHDLHEGRRGELVDVLRAGGVEVLERASTVLEVAGHDVGVVGTKGFVGGFAGSTLPDFGERSLRAVYAETSAEVEAIDRGLRDVAVCPFRIVLLHYSPTAETLHGEPPGIWAFLGSERLAAPIVEHRPDIVLHGHAHAGRFEGRVGGVPVYNVSIPVMGRDFWVFELTAPQAAAGPIR
jgi:Icc-related predicted phosphoesterase